MCVYTVFMPAIIVHGLATNGWPLASPASLAGRWAPGQPTAHENGNIWDWGLELWRKKWSFSVLSFRAQVANTRCTGWTQPSTLFYLAQHLVSTQRFNMSSWDKNLSMIKRWVFQTNFLLLIWWISLTVLWDSHMAKIRGSRCHVLAIFLSSNYL